MTGATPLSVVIITYNEERCIAACLASVAWADEIVVVDSGSTDRTPEICRAIPQVHFFEQDWLGYGPQKNYATSLASHPWILSLDADETVTTELKDEIRDLLQTGSVPHAGYQIHRKNLYRGRWIRHSGWWPDRIVRLFRHNAGRFNDRMVHESVEVVGSVGQLQGAIEHHSFHGPEDFLEKARRYAVPGAQQMRDAGRYGNAMTAVIRGFAAFVKSYVLKRGFLDGRDGLLIAVSSAVGVFYRIIKLAELNEER